MNSKTELALHSILNLDPEVKKDDVLQAMNLLNGVPLQDEQLDQVLRMKEVIALLDSSYKVVYSFIKQGLLDRVYASGRKRVLGISMKSYTRLINSQTFVPPPQRPVDPYTTKRFKLKMKREKALRKTRWELHLSTTSTRKERYHAIDEYLDKHPDSSVSMVTRAADIPLSSYREYCRRKNIINPRVVRREQLTKLILYLFPDRSAELSRRHIIRELQKRNIYVSHKLVTSILQLNGYTKLLPSNKTKGILNALNNKTHAL